MNEPIDEEIEAIRAALAALTPLSAQARASVLDYVHKRLGLEAPGRSNDQREQINAALKEKEGAEPSVHIKALKEQKKPRSANEMAALVGYYLSNLAPVDKRKKAINQKDIETYFKIAGFPLPNQIRVTLANAKTAGYFDAAGGGEYKLSPVGHNLVVHSMPRGSATKRGSEKKASKTKRKRQ